MSQSDIKVEIVEDIPNGDYLKEKSALIKVLKQDPGVLVGQKDLIGSLPLLMAKCGTFKGLDSSTRKALCLWALRDFIRRSNCSDSIKSARLVLINNVIPDVIDTIYYTWREMTRGKRNRNELQMKELAHGCVNFAIWCAKKL